MAVQPALDAATWDIYLDANGDLALVDDGEEVAQHVKQRLDFFQGEWFLDQSLGLPWFQEILNARRYNNAISNRAYAESFIKAEILETPGVTRLVEFSFSSDEVNRAATFNFHFDTLWGDVGTQYFDISFN